MITTPAEHLLNVACCMETLLHNLQDLKLQTSCLQILMEPSGVQSYFDRK